MGVAVSTEHAGGGHGHSGGRVHYGHGGSVVHHDSHMVHHGHAAHGHAGHVVHDDDGCENVGRQCEIREVNLCCAEIACMGRACGA